jgi:hypothetical protein
MDRKILKNKLFPVLASGPRWRLSTGRFAKRIAGFANCEAIRRIEQEISDATGIADERTHVARVQVQVDAAIVEVLELIVPDDARSTRAETPLDSRVLVFGGAPLDGERHLWWNFVSSSRERIERAKADWTAGRFDAVPGETESIPLPAR